ncbi:hypothetical protein BG004_003694 [Podila humilis]|nr:hypothetical protein BG004_003694 [Podila humilis]
MTLAQYEDVALPRVLVAGGGIGGLTLAILLHQAGIPVNVLEKAKVIYPLGSAFSIGAAVIPLFKQMGIYDEFMMRSKPYHTATMHSEDLEVVHAMRFDFLHD